MKLLLKILCILPLFILTGCRPQNKMVEYRSEMADYRSSKKILQICQRQGTLDVAIALLSFDKNKRQKISVLAINPSTSIPTNMCSDVVYYFLTEDGINPNENSVISNKMTEDQLRSHPILDLSSKWNRRVCFLADQYSQIAPYEEKILKEIKNFDK